MKTSLITSAVALAAVFVALALASCEGLTISIQPDGSIGGTYSPPPRPIIIPEK